ncbi:hydrogenase 4 subunit F [Candidatus Nitrosotalea okcheonensis]|uniref:Hydrogenase 4, membrane subunit n=1 Tax=Candidatus Nitrosotalea okcheonensis TaxID=1903276 RepID=A0A2H1FDW7_9ARCH|nr:hydrogenase 4 subunit F [Candidatus Nitrosotalea okcheonensis]SMH70955.1 hydrogenase 4, membrane subunit [Candidatus Nitrosotalea okcheonensis]
MNSISANLTIVFLLLTPLVGGIIVTIFRKKRIIEIVTICSASLILIQVFFILYTIINEKTLSAFGNAFYIDSFGAVILLPISIVGFVSVLYSKNYMGRQYDIGLVDDKHIVRYYQGLSIFLLSMLIVPITNNLGVMWVTVEATTLISVLLIMLYFKENAIEAAWKYLIIATVGLSFALIGTVFFYYANINAGSSEDAMNWTGMVRNSKLFDPNLVKIAFVFILVGYGTKAGLAPMHTWLPDAHSEAPTPVSALLSGVLLNCALYGIIRFHIVSSGTLGPAFSNQLLIILAVVSIGIAAASIYFQKDMKRMLAYSSVEHMGIVSLGIGFGGIFGIYGAILQIINHAIAKPLMFFASGMVSQKYETKVMSKIKGIIKVMPITGALFLIGGFALVGMPPFNIFLSEFLVLSSGFQSGQFLVTILVIAFLVITFAVFLRHLIKMIFGNPVLGMKKDDMGKLAIIPMMILASLVIIFGFYIPEQLQTLVHNASSIINGGGIT